MCPRGHAPATASQASSVASHRFSARASAAASTAARPSAARPLREEELPREPLRRRDQQRLRACAGGPSQGLRSVGVPRRAARPRSHRSSASARRTNARAPADASVSRRSSDAARSCQSYQEHMASSTLGAAAEDLADALRAAVGRPRRELRDERVRDGQQRRGGQRVQRRVERPRDLGARRARASAARRPAPARPRRPTPAAAGAARRRRRAGPGRRAPSRAAP